MSAELVFGIRVKLDDGIDPVAILNEYRAATDGHRSAEFIKMSDAIFAVKPEGFEIHWATEKKPWPVDSSGLTFVPLYETDAKVAHVHFVEQIHRLRQQVERLRDLAKQML